jgi:hypothetical protein
MTTIAQTIQHFRQHIYNLRYNVATYCPRAVRDAQGQSTNGNFARLEAYSQGRLLYAHDAFSGYSYLTVGLKRDFVPSVSQQDADSVGIPRNHQAANHTEPKLFFDFALNVRQYGLNPDYITLVSERDCCRVCLQHSINALNAVSALIQLSGHQMTVVVVETISGRVRNAHELL